MAIRSQAWPGIGGQEGSETSGVSPNNKPCPRAPGLLFGGYDSQILGRTCFWAVGADEEGEIVQASWKHEGT
jgi:hypothetical protein